MTPPDWKPDDDETPWHPDREPEEAGEDAPALRALLEPLQLVLRPIAHERAEPGQTAVAAFLAEMGDDATPIAIQGLPTPVAEALLRSELFAAPTPLLAEAWSRDAGIEVLLRALVPERAMRGLERAMRAESEPWLASVDEAEPPAGEAEAEQVVPFPLGRLWRYRANFVAEGEIQSEMVDLLVRVFGGGATDAKTKEIENFLRDSGLGF